MYTNIYKGLTINNNKTETLSLCVADDDSKKKYSPPKLP